MRTGAPAGLDGYFHEAATNHAYAPYPVWGMCPYDLRSTPDTAVADIASTHPHVGTIDRRYESNSRYQHPARFLAGRAAIGADPLQLASRPVVELVDPASATARRPPARRRAPPSCRRPRSTAWSWPSTRR